LSWVPRQSNFPDFACLTIYNIARSPELFVCLTIYENAETCPPMHVMHAPVPAAAEITSRQTVHSGSRWWAGAGARKTCTIRRAFLIRVRQPRVHLLQLPLLTLKAFWAKLLRHLHRSDKRRKNQDERRKNQSEEHRKIVFLLAKWECTAFKQYKTQGNASNLVQSHFGSPPWKELESGIALLVPRGFDPACWGLIQRTPSRANTVFPSDC